MSSYAVDKVCRRAVMDEQFRKALRDDPERTLSGVQPPLSPSERRWMLAGDVGSLSRAGATSFLLTHLARLELLGLTLESYADRIRTEYAEERDRMRAAGVLPE